MSVLPALSALYSPVRLADTPKISVRPAASAAKPATKPTVTGGAKTLTADQGVAAVTKGVGNATAIFASLASLQEAVRDATPANGAALDKDAAKALTDRIRAVAQQVDQLAAGATAGGANLLSGTSGRVVIAGTTGDQVSIAAQGLDSRSLALTDLSASDAKGLRAATGKIALAVGKAQMAVFTLEAAKGALSAPAPNPATDASRQAVENQRQGASANSASAAVEKALNNQAAANASGYGKAGRSTGSTVAPQGIVSLFT